MADLPVTQSQFKKLLVQAVVVPLAILSLVAAVCFWLISHLLAANAFLEHTHEVIGEARRAQTLLSDMQTSVRGYLLTGQSESLGPYERAARSIGGSLQHIRELTVDNSHQAERIAQIQNHLALWRTQIDDLIALRRRGEADGAALMPRENPALVLQMREAFAEMIRDEETLLEIRSADVVAATRRTLAVSMTVLGLAAALIAWITYRTLISLSRTYGRTLDAANTHAAALAESEARLGGIISSAMDAIISIDAEQRVILFNRAAEHMFGVTAAEALGRPIDRFIPVSFRERHRAEVQRFGETGVTARTMGQLGKITGLRADGEEFPIEAAISQVHSNGQIIYTVIIRDIAERRRAEESIIRINETLQSLLRANPMPVIALDNQARITLWNPAAERLFGWRQEEVLGQTMPHVPPEQQAETQRLFERALGGESFGNVEIRRRTKDGRTLDVALAGAPLRDAAGRIVGMITVSTDVTEQKRAQVDLQSAKEAAERASHAKDQFLAVLSHELRTPLTPVLFTIASLSQNEQLPPEVRSDLALIRRNVELEARLIDDMLDLTRITKGKLRLHYETVDVHDALRHVLGICHNDIQTRQIDLSVRLEAIHYHVRADPARLQQILWNLIKNAVKFTPEGGLITVGTHNGARRSGRRDNLQITVHDSGVGISAEALPRIFDAFEQGDQSVTRQFGGLGLGLAISKTLAEAHGGTIAAASEGKGRGATFTVTLPTVEAPRPKSARPEEAPAAPPRRSARILLVEDHEDTARVLSRLLRAMGYDVSTADSVKAALAQASRQTFDVIVSDIGLPDGSGLDLMRAIRRQQPVTGIALSGFGMDADVRNSREAGFVEHLTKPVDVDTLDATIQQVVSADGHQNGQ